MLEIAIVAFLLFDLLMFTVWKLFLADEEPETDTVAANEAEAEAKEEIQDKHEEPPEQAGPPEASAAPDEVQAPPAGPEEPVEPPGDSKSEAAGSPTPALTVEEAIAPELPPEPTVPGPIRPKDGKLSSRDFREGMLDARDEIEAECLDDRMRRTIKISVKVAPSGEVTFARIHGGLADTSLGKCVLRQVYDIEFPMTFEGGTDTYSLRIR